MPREACVILLATDIERLSWRVRSLSERLGLVCVSCEIDRDPVGPAAVLYFDIPLSVRLARDWPGFRYWLLGQVYVWQNAEGEEESVELV